MKHEHGKRLRQPGLDGATAGNAQEGALRMLAVLLLLALILLAWPVWLWGQAERALKLLHGARLSGTESLPRLHHTN